MSVSIKHKSQTAEATTAAVNRSHLDECEFWPASSHH